MLVVLLHTMVPQASGPSYSQLCIENQSSTQTRNDYYISYYY